MNFYQFKFSELSKILDILFVVESQPAYQMSLADELSNQWERLQNYFDSQDLFPADKGLAKNFNETAVRSVGWPIQEFHKIIRYAHKEIHFRRKFLRKVMGVKE